MFLFVLASCKNRSSNDFKVIVSDTSKTHRNINELYLSKANAKLLNLPEIHNGVDSFEMRVWYWGFGGGHSLIDLRFINDKWSGYRTEIFLNSNGVVATLDSSLTKSLNIPKEIDSIVNYFISDSILELPSQQAIPNFRDGIGDGQGCDVEIATKHFYKSLNYHCPEHFSDKYNQKFLEAVMFLDRFFHFYTPWCK